MYRVYDGNLKARMQVNFAVQKSHLWNMSIFELIWVNFDLSNSWSLRLFTYNFISKLFYIYFQHIYCIYPRGIYFGIHHTKSRKTWVLCGTENSRFGIGNRTVSWFPTIDHSAERFIMLLYMRVAVLRYSWLTFYEWGKNTVDKYSQPVSKSNHLMNESRHTVRESRILCVSPDNM